MYMSSPTSSWVVAAMAAVGSFVGFVALLMAFAKAAVVGQREGAAVGSREGRAEGQKLGKAVVGT